MHEAPTAPFPAGARRALPHFDLAVVGGGFAGLAAAEEAARRGLRTLVVERRRRPGVPCSTTGLLPADALPSVRPPARLLGAGLRTVRIGHRGSGSADWATIEDRGLGLTPTDTPALLALLAERAAAEGAELRFGSALDGAEAGATGRGKCHRLVVDGEVLTADHLIGADGARSALARCLGLPAPSRLLVGVERHLELADTGSLAPDAVSLVVDREWAPGYLAWAFPSLDGAWQVGVLGPAHRRRAPATALAELECWLSKAHGVRIARTLETRAGLVPVGGPVGDPVRAPMPRGVRLAGDAAGHVSPLTAGGIGRAAESGRLAVRELVGDVTAPAVRRALDARCGGVRSGLRLAWQATRLPGGASVAVALARGAVAARAAASVLFGGTSRGEREGRERRGSAPARPASN